MLEELKSHSDFIPIPKLFHSVEYSGLFKKCIDCGKDLLEDDTIYLIEKAIKRDEVIFECAICFDCSTRIHGELSVDSVHKIQDYFERNVDMQDRLTEFENLDLNDITPWIDKCLLKDTPMNECEEYQLYAMCSGEKMIINTLPYMISNSAIEELQGLISEKTKKRLDDFIDDFMRIPPELKDIFKDLILI